MIEISLVLVSVFRRRLLECRSSNNLQNAFQLSTVLSIKFPYQALDLITDVAGFQLSLLGDD